MNTLARICVTGGIACGKSLVGSVLAELGMPVIDADQVCHEKMKSGGPLFERVVAAFGKELVGDDGEINRRELGRLVFSDAAKLRELNRWVHPEVIRAIESWIEEQAARVRVAAMIPLVYEVEWEDAWDWIICVGAPARLQRERLTASGLTESEALARIGVQLPVEEKMRRADYVIFNAGTRECARRQTLRVFQNIVSLIPSSATKPRRIRGQSHTEGLRADR